MKNVRYVAPRWMLVFAFLLLPVAEAVTFNVDVDTSGLSGADLVLAFDFIEGGPPSNTVGLSTLVTNGTVGGQTTIGDVAGIGPWAFADSTFFSELLVSMTAGTTLSFSFTPSNNPPGSSSFPDAFSFFILSPLLLPLVLTSDPTGANALFLFEITGAGPAGGLSVYSATTPGVSITLSLAPGTVTEPTPLLLMAAGVLAMLFFSGRHRNALDHA